MEILQIFHLAVFLLRSLAWPVRALAEVRAEREARGRLGVGAWAKACAAGLVILVAAGALLAGRPLEAIVDWIVLAAFFAIIEAVVARLALAWGAGPSHVRGSALARSGLGRAAAGLEIGGVPIPEEVEPLHFLFLGSTGTGKSQAIGRMLAAIRDRGDRALVVDSGGEAMARLWSQGDALLNPLDARGEAWSPFAEMSGPHDADRLAKSMIPDRSGPDGEWAQYSQSLAAAVLQRLAERGEASNARLLHFLTIAKSGEIEGLVAGLPAQTLFDTGAAKMLSSVRGIIGSYLPAYRYLPPEGGAGAFSVRRWIAEGQGWLWLPYRDDQLAALRSLIACWIGEAVNATLSLRPDPGRRLWIVLDEAASLGRVQALADGLTKGRKFGLRAVLGLQSVSQLREAYGREGAQTLLSCLSSQLFLRAADAESADYASRTLGEQEIVRAEQTQGDSHSSISYRHTTQRAVLASEISGLPPRRGYLRLASEPGRIRLVDVPLAQLGPEIVEPFQPKE